MNSLGFSKLTTFRPPQKWQNCVFVPKCCAMFWSEWNYNFFLFSVFEIWSILYSKYLESSKNFDQNSWPEMANFFVPKNAMSKMTCQCSETYEKTIFRFLRFPVFEIWSNLYLKFLENWIKCHHKLPNYWVLLRFCSGLDQIFRQIFFLLQFYWNVCEKNYIRGAPPP